MMQRQHRGFTLVELAIAMAIIALLAGGLMVGGNTLMERARTNTLISRVTDLAAASRAFKQRYGYFPGDLPNATTWISASGSISPACNYSAGSQIGNGLVDSALESRCALEHLLAAQLITRVERDNTGAYRISSGIGPGEAALWHRAASNENAIRVTLLPCDAVRELDTRLDPENATPLSTGRVIALDESGAMISGCTPSGSNAPIATVLALY